MTATEAYEAHLAEFPGDVAGAMHAAEIAVLEAEGLAEGEPSSYDMSIHTNPDAMAWTKFFRETNPDCNVPDDVMFGWFANAMMAMHDHLRGGPVVLPDGSAFFVASVEADAQ